MRVTALIFLAGALLAGQSDICVAQGRPAEKTSAAQGVGRVGTLSPDEARRAARARKRATSSAHVDPAKIVGNDRSKQATSLKSRPREASGSAEGSGSSDKSVPHISRPRSTGHHLADTRPPLVVTQPSNRMPSKSGMERRRLASRTNLHDHIRVAGPHYLRPDGPLAPRVYASARRLIYRAGDERSPPLYRGPRGYEPGYGDRFGYPPPRPRVVYVPDFPPYPQARYDYGYGYPR